VLCRHQFYPSSVPNHHQCGMPTSQRVLKLRSCSVPNYQELQVLPPRNRPF
jgi:hypothetical protein